MKESHDHKRVTAAGRALKIVLEQQRALPFKPLRGHLGIFRVPALDLWKDKEGSPCSPA